MHALIVIKYIGKNNNNNNNAVWSNGTRTTGKENRRFCVAHSFKIKKNCKKKICLCMYSALFNETYPWILID